MNEEVVQSVWDERVAWSKTADRLKKGVIRWRSIALILTVTGAALQTLSANSGIVGPMKIGIGIAGATSLVLVPFIARFFLTAEETQKWLRSRSVSEGIKSEVYKYRAGADPYVEDGADDRLAEKTREIRGYAANLERELARTSTQSSSELMPPALDPESYITHRVVQQVVEYYRPRAKLCSENAEKFRLAEIGFAGLAAILGAAATAIGGAWIDGVAPWVAVLTTIGASVAAHAAANRYDFEATTFFATARQLQDLADDRRRRGLPPQPSSDWSKFVSECEGVISAENRAWMAKVDEHA